MHLRVSASCVEILGRNGFKNKWHWFRGNEWFE